MHHGGCLTGNVLKSLVAVRLAAPRDLVDDPTVVAAHRGRCFAGLTGGGWERGAPVAWMVRAPLALLGRAHDPPADGAVDRDCARAVDRDLRLVLALARLIEAG